MSKLKPCPLCGNEDIVLSQAAGEFVIGCENCDIDIVGGCKRDAICSWNFLSIVRYKAINDCHKIVFYHLYENRDFPDSLGGLDPTAAPVTAREFIRGLWAVISNNFDSLKKKIKKK